MFKYKRLFLFLSIYIITWSHLRMEILGLKCYVCNDCETSHNDTYLLECKETEERCLTMILATGQTDRACGSKDSCKNIEPPTPKPAKVKKREEFTNSVPKKRTVRQLLQQQEKEKEEPPKEVPEYTSKHCCMEDECNNSGAGFSLSQFKMSTLIFLNPLFLKHLLQLQHSTFSILLTSLLVYISL